MFTAPRRPLVYPLKEGIANEISADTPVLDCTVPEFPEDGDEKITVLFRLSLNDFVALASAIDVGSDIAYGRDAVKIWQLWVTAYMCAQFCDEVAACLENEYPAIVDALANLITSNPTILAAIASSITSNGSSVPGAPITPQQAQSDISPANTKTPEGECINDALWGAILYLVQAGNRAITDFFEQTEVATNSVELAGIVAQNVPAAGGFAASALEFADQIAETLQEGYAGAYTEAFEEQLACDIFCAALLDCEVTPDLLVSVMEERLGYVDGTLDFGILMNRVGSGVFVGTAIADAAFYIYFTALKFGQQFGGVFGFRPLTDMMSLGADLLASDNWEVLCSCGSLCQDVYDFTIDEQGWTSSNRASVWTADYIAGVGWRHTTGDVASGVIYCGIKTNYGTSKEIVSIKVTYALSADGNDTNIINASEHDGTGGSFSVISDNATIAAPGTEVTLQNIDQFLTQDYLEIDGLCYGYAGTATLTITQIRVIYNCP